MAEWLVEAAFEREERWLREVAPGRIVAAVPMHWKRELARGYNQAELVAQELARRLNLPILPSSAVVRTRATPPQVRSSSREDRTRNLSGAFLVKNRRELEGKRILLVDDVMTTGTTLALVAGELLRAGAADVAVFTVARAILGDPLGTDMVDEVAG